MQCVSCGREMPEGVSFCPHCGARASGGDQASAGPIYQAEVKGMFKSGKLAVYRDRVEFSTSSVQKSVFNYDSLVSVKKRLVPTPAILFITEDGRTEACAAASKNVHEAFLHIEQAARPYIEARRERLLAQGIRYSLVSAMGLANNGILNLSDDRAEFQSKSGKCETLPFQSVRSASLTAMGALEFSLFDGSTMSFVLDKECREEVLAFVREALAPYLAKRKADLLARGIYFSFPSLQGQERGTLDIREDRAEFTAASGRRDAVPFREVRTAGLYGEVLELALVDGTSRSFTVDREDQAEVLAFVQEAVRPYAERRTAGFDLAFGGEERIEINRERGVFHILRQGGAVITEECPVEGIIRCQQAEPAEVNRMLTGIMSGGKALVNKAAGAAGKAGVPEGGELIRSLDILLTIRTEEAPRTEQVRFGDFPLGMSRTNPKYARYAGDAAGLMDYLREACPDCELVIPEPPEPEPAPLPAELPEDAGGAQPASGPAAPVPAGEAPAQEDDPLGIRKYIQRVSSYISTCQAPRAIAFQGSGEELRRLAGTLEGQYRDNVIWLHGKQIARSELDEKLPMFIGASLISQLDGSSDGRGIKFAKASLNLAITMISKGHADGQPLIDAIFKDDPKNSPEDLVKIFSDLVRKRTGGERDKVIVFVDDLDHLAPGKAVEILEGLEDFLECENCVFVAAADYAAVVRGFSERYGQDQGDAFFNKIFRISFRLPASGRQLENSVRGNLEHMGLPANDQAETALYCRLLERSVGSDPRDVSRLFDQFQLLKTLADEDLYEDGRKRLILFGLLCMQTKFRGVYEHLVRMKRAITPELLTGLCRLESAGESADFPAFAQVFCGVIAAGQAEDISREECDSFAQVLEFSSITFR